MEESFFSTHEIPELSLEHIQGFPTPTVLGRREIQRPEGYVLPGYKAFAVDVEAGGLTVTGFGEGPEEIALKKAKSEAVERLALALHCRKTGIGESSNGWAAHSTADLAVRNAVLELIERDVALSTWENGGPFYLIPESMWPEEILTWRKSQKIRSEYFDLQILLSVNSKGACVSALLFNERKNFVAGHASKLGFEEAILSAVNECLRAAHAALRFEHLAEVSALHASTDFARRFEPGAHSLAYAYQQTLPTEILIESESEKAISTRWRKHQDNFQCLVFGDIDVSMFGLGSLIVARVKSPRYRQIYWGKNQDLSKRNLHPHFVG